MDNRFGVTRRGFLMTVLAAGTAPSLAHASLTPTPKQPAGPFYPTSVPLEADADLVTVAGRTGPATGTVTHVIGRALDPDGRPIPGALVEIWQCDAFGRYHHPLDGGGIDPNFQGYGRIETGADGGYHFRTIRPVAYGSRAPHIQFAVNSTLTGRFTTQMYVAGESSNETDFILSRIIDPAARARVIVDLAPAPGIEAGAVLAPFDIVLAG